MNNHIKVSVIIPIYNVERYLEKCLISVLNQSHTNLEIILINDGSPDESMKICMDYEERDERILVIDQSNGGLSAARNTGIKHASGDYTYFLDSDDYIEGNLISYVLSKVLESNADVGIFGYNADYLDDNDDIIKSYSISSETGEYEFSTFKQITLDDKTIGLLGYAWNKLYKTNIIKSNNLLFPDGISLVEDIIFNSKYLALSNRLVFLEESLIHYCQRGEETLGNKLYADYFDLKRRSYFALRTLLGVWGISNDEIDDLLKKTIFNDLKYYLFVVSNYEKISEKERISQISKIISTNDIDFSKQEMRQLSVKDRLMHYFISKRYSRVIYRIYNK